MQLSGPIALPCRVNFELSACTIPDSNTWLPIYTLITKTILL